MKELAAASGGPFVDQFHPFVAAHGQGPGRKSRQPHRRRRRRPPRPPGQALMAWAILKGLNFPPLVSAAEIDAAAGKVAKADQLQDRPTRGQCRRA